MQSYSHLSDNERDQIAILRAAGRSMGVPGRSVERTKSYGVGRRGCDLAAEISARGAAAFPGGF